MIKQAIRDKLAILVRSHIEGLDHSRQTTQEYKHRLHKKLFYFASFRLKEKVSVAFETLHCLLSFITKKPNDCVCVWQARECFIMARLMTSSLAKSVKQPVYVPPYWPSRTTALHCLTYVRAPLSIVKPHLTKLVWCVRAVCLLAFVLL